MLFSSLLQQLHSFLLPSSFLAARPPSPPSPPPSFLQLPPSFRNRARLKLPHVLLSACAASARPLAAVLGWLGGNDRAGRRGVGVRSREERRGGPPHLILLLHLLSPSLQILPLPLSSPSLTRGRRLSNLSRAPALYELLEWPAAAEPAEAVAVEPARTNNNRARGRQQTTQHIRCLRAWWPRPVSGPPRPRWPRPVQKQKPLQVAGSIATLPPPLHSTTLYAARSLLSSDWAAPCSLSTRPEELSTSLFFTLSERYLHILHVRGPQGRLG